ncbi:Hypothetical_protein [Hexamita inflata]|uniref:Hypothetical_protein n=1 Tax=Hexamita inflata TaxID=28002 RepID=A0AA86QXD3_9EUKA|nr:Hypothetical protein HINF_LOCUS50651 [Hexamita inflata]
MQSDILKLHGEITIMAGENIIEYLAIIGQLFKTIHAVFIIYPESYKIQISPKFATKFNGMRSLKLYFRHMGVNFIYSFQLSMVFGIYVNTNVQNSIVLHYVGYFRTTVTVQLQNIMPAQVQLSKYVRILFTIILKQIETAVLEHTMQRFQYYSQLFQQIQVASLIIYKSVAYLLTHVTWRVINDMLFVLYSLIYRQQYFIKFSHRNIYL